MVDEIQSYEIGIRKQKKNNNKIENIEIRRVQKQM